MGELYNAGLVGPTLIHDLLRYHVSRVTFDGSAATEASVESLLRLVKCESVLESKYDLQVAATGCEPMTQKL